MKISGKLNVLTTCEEDIALLNAEYEALNALVVTGNNIFRLATQRPAGKPKKKDKRRNNYISNPSLQDRDARYTYHGYSHIEPVHIDGIPEIWEAIEKSDNEYTIKHNHGWNRFENAAAFFGGMVSGL